MPTRWFEHFTDATMLAPPSPTVARREVHRFLRRLEVLLALTAALLALGGLAFAHFEHVAYGDGVLWALLTIATVGSHREPTSAGGKATIAVLILLGLGTIFYLLVTLVELFVAGHLSGLLEVRRMERKIASLDKHYLICGFGRVGRQVARDLQSAGVPFVVIDDNPEIREHVEELDVLHIDGRASDDDVLLEAGIVRARGVIACVDSDAENIFITLTARGLRPDIEIVARASEEASEQKLMRAGANEVVSPYKASGHAMARRVLATAEPKGAEQVPAVPAAG